MAALFVSACGGWQAVAAEEALLFSATSPGQASEEASRHFHELYSWDEGLRNLVLQLVQPFPLEESIRIAVVDFKEADGGQEKILAERLESDLRQMVSRVEGVSVNEGQGVRGGMAETPSRYSISGLYHKESYGFRINAILREFPGGRIVSSAQALVRLDDAEPGNRAAASAPDNAETFDERFRLHQFAVNKLLAMEAENPDLKVDVWTSRKVFEVGDEVTFFFRSNRDAYVTLVDVGTSGDLRVLYPNRFDKENLVKADQIYSVPGDNSDFRIRVDGPPGLERIKVFATQEPVFVINGSSSEVFYSVSEEDGSRTGDLLRMTKRLKDQSWAESSTEIYITGDGIQLPPKGRSRTIKPKIEPKPPKKPVDIIGVPGLKPEEEEDQPSPTSDAAIHE